LTRYFGGDILSTTKQTNEREVMEMKTQKTFKVANLGFEPKVGQVVVLVSHENINVQRSGYEKFIIIDTQDGIPGNMDHTIKRYHGWRGTYNDVATYAHGLRKILKVTELEIGAGYDYKITVGRDLHPDWD
jgi:hypothetical protein